MRSSASTWLVVRPRRTDRVHVWRRGRAEIARLLFDQPESAPGARVADISEFFQPSPPQEFAPHRPPPWTGPPDGTLPGVVALELLLARSPTAAIYITHLEAYPVGFVFELKAITVSAEHEPGLDLFGRHWPMVGEKRDEIPPTLLRIGVQFADERKATNITGHGQPPAGPVMWPLGGGGGGRGFHQAYWMWPLPPSGPIALVCEWPAAGIPFTGHEVNAQVILDAAARARALFPDEGGDKGGTWSTTTVRFHHRDEPQAEHDRPG